MGGPRWQRRDGLSNVPAQRFDPFDLVVLGAGLASQALHACAGAVGGVETLAKAHANWRADRRDMADAVRDTIERL